MSILAYRDYEIKSGNHPIKIGTAWFYTHEDYDGPGDNRCGVCDSIKECIETINDLDDVDIEPEEVDANAELLRLEDELVRMEEARSDLEEKCRKMAVTRYITRNKMTIDQCWTWAELQDAYGFHGMIQDYLPILCRDGEATRKWFEWNTEFFETDAFIKNKGLSRWVNSYVTEADLEQIATSLATKEQANPA